MADNRAAELAAKIARLSPRELQVLKYRCLGWDYEKIAQTLVINERSVKTYVNRIYDKLDLKGYGRAGRMKLLYEEYCPLLEKSEPAAARMPDEPAVEVIEGEVQEEIEETLSVEDERMVDEDQYAIVPVKPAYMTSPFRPRRRRWPWLGLAAGVVLVAAAGVIWLLQSDFGQRLWPLGGAQEAATETAQSDQAALPIAVTQTPLIQTQVVVVTATAPVVADTATSAPLPTPTLKAIYEEEESVSLRDDVYIYLNTGFMSDGSVRCDKPQPGFGVSLQLNNDSDGDYLLRYQASDFHAVDDLGNEYPVYRVGFHNCRVEPGPIEDIIHTYSDNLFIMTFRGQIAFGARYLLITVEFSGAGPFVFRKQL